MEVFTNVLDRAGLDFEHVVVLLEQPLRKTFGRMTEPIRVKVKSPTEGEKTFAVSNVSSVSELFSKIRDSYLLDDKEYIELIFAGRVLKESGESVGELFQGKKEVQIHAMRKKVEVRKIQNAESQREEEKEPQKEAEEDTGFVINDVQMGKLESIMKQQQLLFQEMFGSSETFGGDEKKESSLKVEQRIVNEDEEVIEIEENEGEGSIGNDSKSGKTEEEKKEEEEEKKKKEEEEKKKEEEERRIQARFQRIWTILKRIFKFGLLSLILSGFDSFASWMFTTIIICLVYAIFSVCGDILKICRKGKKDREKLKMELLKEHYKKTKREELQDKKENATGTVVEGEVKEEEEEDIIEIVKVKKKKGPLRVVFDFVYLFFRTLLPTYNIERVDVQNE